MAAKITSIAFVDTGGASRVGARMQLVDLDPLPTLDPWKMIIFIYFFLFCAPSPKASNSCTSVANGAIGECDVTRVTDVL